MKGLPPAGIFIVAHVGFYYNDKPDKHLFQAKIPAPIPDVATFEGLECWMSSDILVTCLQMVQSKCPDVKHLACANLNCDKHRKAVAMCTWYPFVIQDGDMTAVFQNKSTTPWMCYTWCGDSCKFDMLQRCMQTTARLRDEYGLLGGDYYCFYCGRMQTRADYESLKNDPVSDEEASKWTSMDDMIAYMASRLPVVVDIAEKLVYCRDGDCKAKCRQRAPPQLLALMHRHKKKI